MNWTLDICTFDQPKIKYNFVSIIRNSSKSHFNIKKNLKNKYVIINDEI